MVYYPHQGFGIRIHLVNCFESRLMMPFTGKLEPNIVKDDIARAEVISVVWCGLKCMICISLFLFQHCTYCFHYICKFECAHAYIEVTRFRNCAAQFRNRVAILKSEDNFEIGTQFRNFLNCASLQIARNIYTQNVLACTVRKRTATQWRQTIYCSYNSYVVYRSQGLPVTISCVSQAH